MFFGPDGLSITRGDREVGDARADGFSVTRGDLGAGDDAVVAISVGDPARLRNEWTRF
jgi:hypothetical protein